MIHVSTLLHQILEETAVDSHQAGKGSKQLKHLGWELDSIPGHIKSHPIC